MLDVQALGYLTGGCSCGFSDSPKPSRVMATKRGKVIKRRDANPCEEGKPWQEDTSQKVVGSNPGTSKVFFAKV